MTCSVNHITTIHKYVYLGYRGPKEVSLWTEVNRRWASLYPESFIGIKTPLNPSLQPLQLTSTGSIINCVPVYIPTIHVYIQYPRTRVYKTAKIHNSPKLEATQMSSTVEWMNNLWYSERTNKNKRFTFFTLKMLKRDFPLLLLLREFTFEKLKLYILSRLFEMCMNSCEN